MDSEKGLVGYWKLNGDCRDSKRELHGENHGVIFEKDKDGTDKAGVFNGIDSFISVADNPKLSLGEDDFSISAWIKSEKDISNSPGNIIQKFDPVNRCGINLSIPGCSPGYSSQNDIRNLHFGIDDNIEGSWIDCGRPWEGNPTISCMAVYQGELFVGIIDAINPRDACKVFRYAGGKGWVDCGRVGNDLRTYTVRSMIVHKGKLYAAVGKFWAGERCRTGEIPPTRIYCYDGDGNWKDAGEIEGGINIRCFASFKGEIYATTSILNRKIYKYTDGKKWQACSEPLSGAIERFYGPCTMQIYKNNLYAAGNGGSFFRYEGGNSWKCIGKNPYNITQTHCLNIYQGRLYAGTWPYGHVLRYEADDQWTDCGRMGVRTTKPTGIDEIMDLTVYNGKMYGTAIPKAEIYRYDDDKRWTKLVQFGINPDYSEYQGPSWRRVTCMAVYAGRLFAGTGTCSCDNYIANDMNLDENAGRVFCMEAGYNVTYDDDIGSKWTHIVATRTSDSLSLYINGEMVNTRPASIKKQCNVSNKKPLLIGFGEQNFFQGKIKDVRIYNRALKTDEVRRINN
jgi:hypothetical protein